MCLNEGLTPLSRVCVATYQGCFHNWVDSVQDKDYWVALVSVALNLQVT